MVALGPRVGGAHVDVNLKFDEKSLGQVGKQIHKQLSKLSDSLVQVGERNRKVYQEIGKDAVTAWRALLGSIVSGAPLIGSALSGVAGAATMLAGALYSTGQAAYAFAPLLAAIGVAAGTSLLGLKSFFKALKDGDLSSLTPSAKSAAQAVQGLGGAWSKVRDEVQENMFKGLSGNIARLGTTLLPVMQRGLGKMGTALNGLAKDMLDYVNSSAGLKVINRFLNNSADIFTRFSGAIVPFLDGFLRLMNALAPAGKRLADRITDISERFQGWTKAEGFGKRIDSMMKGAEKTAGLLFKVLGNLGSAIANIFNAANPSTNTFLQMLVDVTQRFEDWTSSIGGQNSIAQWAAQSVDVMRQFGKTAEAVFKVIAELADPRVIISFLKTVEGAFNILGQLPLDKIVTAFVHLSETLQPVSSLFLAIVIGGATLNILLGSLIGQVGGLFSIFAKLIKFKIITNILKGMGGGAKAAEAGVAGAAKKTGLLSRAWGFLVGILTKLKSAFGAVTGFFTKTSAATGKTASTVGRLGGAFKPVMGILARFAKFAGPVGIAIWIGTIIAKSEDLQKKLGGVWDSMKVVWSSLVGAFKEIGTALKPLAPAAKATGTAFGFIFDFVDKLVGLAVGVFLDMIIYGFKSLANVIKGAGKIFAGLINILVGLFTLDFSKMWDGLKQMASGVVPLLKGLFGLFITFFAPAKLAKLGLGAIKGLGSGIVRAMPGILAVVGRFTLSVVKFFLLLTPRLLMLGGRAIVALGRAVIKNTPKVLLAAGRIYIGVIKWIARLPARLISLGIRAITRLVSGIVKTTPKVLSAAGKIVAGVINAIAKMPGRLLSLGKSAVSKLGGAIKSGVGALKGIAGNIVSTVTGIIRGLPGKLTALGGQFLSAGKSLGGKILQGVRDGLNALGDMIGSVASSLKSGINNAIGLPKDFSFKVLGKKVGFTIPGFAKGTNFAPGGLAMVGERGPELVNLPRGSKVHTAAETSKMQTGSGLPPKVILRIGSRDFVAYVEEIADDRIDAADSLTWQGA